MEILQSRILARDAVKDLRLYVQYRTTGRLTKQIVYKTQPVSVDLDSIMLEQWDKELLENSKSIQLTLTRQGKQYEVSGETMLNGKPTGGFSQKLASLPGTVKTDYGVLTLIQNGKKEMQDGDKYLVNILPPMAVATQYAKAINIAPTSKMTSIAELTLTDQTFAVVWTI
jgi:hypothetical protein